MGKTIVQSKLQMTADEAKTAIVIDEQELVNMLSSERGATFITFVAETEPKMRKTGNPFNGRVVKVAKVNGMVNFHYDKAVERRLEKEGKDVADFQRGTSWHEPVIRADGTLTPFCQHKTKGDWYLRFMLCGNAIESEYRYIDGTIIDTAEIIPWLTKSKPYTNQGTDEPVKILTYKIGGIVRIVMNNTNYIVKR